MVLRRQSRSGSDNCVAADHALTRIAARRIVTSIFDVLAAGPQSARRSIRQVRGKTRQIAPDVAPGALDARLTLSLKDVVSAGKVREGQAQLLTIMPAESDIPSIPP